MRGNDGQLYELLYQAQDGWLTRKMRKISKSASSYASFISILNWAGNDPIRKLSLDDARNMLYTVTKKNHIELYYLGRDGTEFHHIAKLSNLADSLRKYNTFDDHLVALYPTLVTESRLIHAVGINSSGHRLFFTTSGSSFQYNSMITQNGGTIEPTTLALYYVLPPPNTGDAIPQQGAKVHEAYYSNGLSVVAQALDELDRILVVCPHAGKILLV
jgi:nuclear pore complex protein Nup155